MAAHWGKAGFWGASLAPAATAAAVGLSALPFLSLHFVVSHIQTGAPVTSRLS